MDIEHLNGPRSLNNRNYELALPGSFSEHKPST